MARPDEHCARGIAAATRLTPERSFVGHPGGVGVPATEPNKRCP